MAVCNCVIKRIAAYNARCWIFKRTAVSIAPNKVEEQIKIYKSRLEAIPVERIRNFSIIAHVDHGKSTLADRLLEVTGALTPDPTNKQVLDKLQVERERGITVKAQTASLIYTYQNEDYLLNLIDTPGHVDFSNEVSRSLASCQGVILLVDANQGVQAQTVANFYLAFTQEKVIIPALNKIDLKNADPDGVSNQLETLFGIPRSDILQISAKMGIGVNEAIEAIITRIPPPPSDRSLPLQALLFDSWYDRYKGAIGLIYIKNGELGIGDEIKWCHSGKEYVIKSLGVLSPGEIPMEKLMAGQVGFMSCNMRSSNEACIGDTLFHKNEPVEALTGFIQPQPMVFAGIYPFDQSQHPQLRSAIEKLTLNDNAVSVTVESSPALGHGWRLGFLGILHMEVFNQRLEQEYDAQAIVTSPGVTYKIILQGQKAKKLYGKDELIISNPASFPNPTLIQEMQEPIVKGTIITPDAYLGDVMSLCLERRGVQNSAINIDNNRIMMEFTLPLNEIVVDFHDKLKSVTSGFASFDYEDLGFITSNLVKLTILLNGVEVDELSTIVHCTKAVTIGKKMCHKLSEVIPRQQFQIAVQAKVGGKIVARENIKPYRKDVTAKLYGGDVTRRNKLLQRQAEGKKRLKMVANIALPRETFIEVLKR